MSDKNNISNLENKPIIDEFIKLSKYIQYQIDNTNITKEKNSNQFRLKTILNAIKIMKKYPNKISTSNDLEELPGIGIGIIKRIDEIIKNGYLEELTSIPLFSPHELLIEDLTKIVGIGRKTAMDLINTYHIISVDDLINKYNDNKIKLSKQIILGIKYYNTYKQQIPRREMTSVLNFLKKEIAKVNSKIILTVCGSYRREKTTSNDVDVLISHPDIKQKKDILNMKNNYLQTFVNILKEDNFITDDLIEDITTKYMGFFKYKNKPIRRIDILFVPYISYPAALLHFTGSGEFNQRIRNIAKKNGYKLNEYGLFKITDGKTKLYNKFIPVSSEKEIFDILDIEYLEPKER
jgi:DNA polymerase/3'-5' exonuclease PolX